MRLLFCSNVPRTIYSGMGRWTYSIAKELVRAGHSSSEWYADELAIPELLRPLNIFIAPLRTVAKIWTHRKEFDVVFLHEPLVWPSALLARILPSIMPAIFVVSHGVETRGKQEFLKAARHGYFTYPILSRIKHALFVNWQSDLGLRLAWKILCLNRRDKYYIEEKLNRLSKDVIVITNGIDIETDIPLMESLPRQDQTVLVLSAWREYKGIRLLPQIWQSVLTELPEARLRLVGTCAEIAQVLASFPSEVHSSIEVIPHVENRAAMHQIMLTSGIFLMPSIFEGSPLALIESMACGLPVVASCAGGIPDILADGTYGHIFDWWDTASGAKLLIAMLKQREQREEYSRRAIARANSLTWKVSVQPILATLALRHQ